MSGEAGPPELTVAIATIAERVESLSLERMPPAADRCYHIICQQSGSAEVDERALQALGALAGSRRDVTYETMAMRGVTKSRNRAIDAAGTPLLLFSDDDVRVLDAGVRELLTAFSQSPAMAVMMGQTLDAGGLPAKQYPRNRETLNLFNCARVGTVELAIRRDPVVKAGIRFDEGFGAGSANPIGDEYIFVTDGLKAGLKGEYHPIPLAQHPQPSSGTDWTSEVSTRSRGRVFNRVFGWAAPIVKLGFFARHLRRFRSAGEMWAFAKAFFG